MQSLSVMLEDALDTQAVDTITMSINHGSPTGYVDTELTETGVDTKTFEDAAETITLVISNYTALDDEVVDTFDVTLTDDTLSITNETRTTTETQTDSNTFVVATYSAVFYFPWEPTDTTQDQFDAQIFGDGTVTAKLIEDGVDSPWYIDDAGNVLVEIESEINWSPSVRDVITVRVSSGELQIQDAPLVLQETANDSMIFADHLLTGHGDTDEIEPTELTLFNMRVRRWPSIFGETFTYGAVSPVEYIDVECTTAGPGIVESADPLVATGFGYGDSVQAALGISCAVIETVQVTVGSNSDENLAVFSKTRLINQRNKSQWTARFVKEIVKRGKVVEKKNVTRAVETWTKWGFQNSWGQSISGGVPWLSFIRGKGIATLAWCDRPKGCLGAHPDQKATCVKNCATAIRDSLAIVTEEWQGPINLQHLKAILQDCGRWASWGEAEGVVPRSILFLAAHGDAEFKSLGNIRLYSENGTYTSLGPDNVNWYVNRAYRELPKPGWRGLKLVILSVCDVNEKLSSHDLYRHRVDPLHKEKRVEEKWSLPASGAARRQYGASWLETVFLNKIIIGWKGKPGVPRIYDFWAEKFFPVLGLAGARTGQTIEVTLKNRNCNWGKPGTTREDVWTTTHLVVRTLTRETENAQGQTVYDNWYYFDKWIPRASTGRDN